MADIHWKTDVATVALARREGNVGLAERQLRSRLCSHGHSDLATLLMNDVLRMKLSSTGSAHHAVQIQFQGAKLLHRSVSALSFSSACIITIDYLTLFADLIIGTKLLN